MGQALKGAALVPLDKLEVNNIHSFGGCVVLEDAGRRYSLPELLAPLTQRSGSLVHALIFGGLLFPPSVAPFYVESRPVRLAMFCGLDPDKERFEFADLMGALRELDDRWPQVCAQLMRPPHGEVRAVTLFRTSRSEEKVEMGALGMDAEGIPVPLVPQDATGAQAGLLGFLQQVAQQSKMGPPLLTLDEETAARVTIDRLGPQPYVIELAPETLATLLRQLNQAQLLHSMREGGPVEVRHQGERYVLAPSGELREAEAQEARMRMGSLKELTSITTGRPVEAPAPRSVQAATSMASGVRGVHTNVPAERLPAAVALEWANRARTTRGAFAPVQIVMGRPSSGEGVITWRNHQNLQFLTHRLRCHLQAEWRGRGEVRPVEEVLRDLQEIHRATLTVDGVVVRRLATHPAKAVSALLTKLDLWPLFESVDVKK